MKRLLTLLFISISLLAHSQQANKLLQAQSKPYQQFSANNYLYVDTTDFKIWAANIDSLKMKIWNMAWVLDSITSITKNVGDARYAQLVSLSNYLLKSDSGLYQSKYGYDTSRNNIYSNLLLKANTASLTNYLLKSDSLIYQTKYRSDTSRSNLYTALSVKQPILSGSGFVKISGSTISYDNSSYLTSTSLSNYLQKSDSSIFTTQYRIDTSKANIRSSIPAQVNITGGQNIKVTGAYPTITIADSNSVQFYNGSGKINQSRLKVWSDIVTPTTGNGYSIDITSAGFTNILSVNAITETNVSTTSTMRNVEIKSVSTSAVVVNIAIPNATVVATLGLTLLGVPTFIGSGTGTKVHLTVVGY